MELSLDQRGDVRIVRVKDATFTDPVLTPFIAEMRRILEGGVRLLIIDLAAVTFIDGASIGCLIKVQQLVTHRGGSLKVTSPSPRVHMMLSMVMADMIVEVHAGEAEALAAFGEAASGRAAGRARMRKGKPRRRDTSTT